MLVSSFVSGIRDLLVTPSSALINSPKNPTRLGIGVAQVGLTVMFYGFQMQFLDDFPTIFLSQGTLSFFSHGASGFFGYFSKLAAAAGQAVATISMDPDFRDWHNDKVVVEATNLNREWKRRGVQNVGLMITRPLADIFLGVVGGVTGVVMSPVKGFKRNGPAGVLVGTVAAGIGVFAKPVVRGL